MTNNTHGEVTHRSIVRQIKSSAKMQFVRQKYKSGGADRKTKYESGDAVRKIKI